MKKTLIAIALSSVTLSAQAGINGLTSHSRANCGNNESITWDATQYHDLSTDSKHFKSTQDNHIVKTGWENTWRSAAVHWGESFTDGEYVVSGSHWELIKKNRIKIKDTVALDCAIYEGWWESKGPIPPITKPKKIEMSESDFDKLNKIPNGVSIVPLSESALPENIKNEIRKELLQEKLPNYIGYEHYEDSYPKTLINIGIKKDIVNNNNPMDTHLKINLDDVVIGFKFKPIQALDKNDFIGYAAVGTYVQGKGWSGVRELFSNKELGTCFYGVSNVSLAQGAAQLNKEMITYKVNNKPTLTNVKGSINTGFIYRVDWFDNQYFSNIECAKMDYDKFTLGKIIELANKVDKQ